MTKKLLALSFVLSAATVFCLQWPCPSSKVTSGYGIRNKPANPLRFEAKWHYGIDITTNRTSVRMKNVSGTEIQLIGQEQQRNGSPKGYGNYIQIANWFYAHLLYENGTSWRFASTDTQGVWYFALKGPQDEDWTYYSTRSPIWIDKVPFPATININESEYFAYSGSSGSTGTQPHLHLEKRLRAETASAANNSEHPMKYLYAANSDDADHYIPPVNNGSPIVENLFYDQDNEIIHAEVRRACASDTPDVNTMGIVVPDYAHEYELSFYPSQNVEIPKNISDKYKSGLRPGTEAGNWVDDDSDNTAVHTIFLEETGRRTGCSSNNGRPDMMAYAEDATGNMGYDYWEADSFRGSALGPSPTCPPGGDNADDNYSASSTTVNTAAEGDAEDDGGAYSSSYWLEPKIAIFSNAYLREARWLLRNDNIRYEHIKTEISFVNQRNTNLLIFPTGGLNGLSQSDYFKQGLADYIWNGGNILVFAQQYGYDYAALPTPNGVPIQAYGWAEDQSCQFGSVYYEDWHQTLSALTNAVPNINVDGYFTSYPDYSKVLLRRIKNDQPAAILYQYGNGHVLATTMYSDYGTGTSQAFAEERNVVRDMINWLVHPVGLPETQPSGTVNLELPVFNNTDTDAAGVRIRVYNPNRTSLLKEESHELSLPIGSAVPIALEYQAINTPLGIYHVDYSLVDAFGDTIYPHVEPDAARFAVAAPPANPHIERTFSVSIQSDKEQYIYGDPADLTINIWNNTAQGQNVTVNWNLNWNGYSDSRTLYIAGNSMETIEATVPHVYHSGNFGVHVRDEAGDYLASAKKGVWPTYPKAYAERLSLDAELYNPTEIVYIDGGIKNYIHLDWPATVKVTVLDPSNVQVFSDEQSHVISAFSTESIQAQFPLHQGMPTGTYTVTMDAYFLDPIEGAPKLITTRATSFSIQASRLEVIPTLPAILDAGPVFIPFHLSNTGRVDVQSGTLTVTLKDPEGLVLTTETKNFGLQAGQETALDFNLDIAALKYGVYALTFVQSDETRTGQETTVALPNLAQITAQFDKPSYSTGETAHSCSAHLRCRPFGAGIG